MRSATMLRTFFLSLLVGGISFGEASAQTPRTTAPSTTTKDGSSQKAPVPGQTQPGTPVPIYRPSPTDKAPAPAPAPRKDPAPIYRPAPDQNTSQAPRPAPQQPSTIDRNYDVNGDGVISKAERKRMKEIRKAEKKRARELRKADHEVWVDQHKREEAAQGLEQRQHDLKHDNDREDDDRDDDHESGHGRGHGNGHGKGKK